jgi:hypothetical protein
MSKRRKSRKFNVRIMVMGLVALSLIIGSVVWAQQTSAADTKSYFRFEIPKNPDGSAIEYSAGWFGRMQGVPQNTTVVVYNDKEGYGIAYTTDTKTLPKEVTAISQTTADSTTASLRDVKDVYFGTKLVERWLPEVKIADSAGMEIKSLGSEPTGKVILCPVCGVVIGQDSKGLTDSRTVLTCANGHKSVTASYEKVETLAK